MPTRVALAAAAAIALVLPVRAAAGVRWRPATFAVRGSSPVRVATVTSNGSTVYAALIDHTRTRLALYPGLYEPPVADPRGRGEVPSARRRALLATFNGGFKQNAGAGGFVVNGHVDAPLRDGMGTLVEYRNGALAVLEWEGRTAPGELVLARQNLPPLVWAGRPTARTADPSLWGTTLVGTATWRTAAGVTSGGDLVYAAGDGQTPASLAAVMVRLGAVRAIQLDINPEWPTFIAYGARYGRAPLMLVPNPQQSPGRYLTPDARDFFAVYAYGGGRFRVPFR